MVEITITKLKNKYKDALLDFLYKRTKEICFSAFHVYKVDKNIIDDLIDEYKEKCKFNLKEARDLYRKSPERFKDAMKKLHLEDDDAFEEFTLDIYQNEMAKAIPMKENLEKLALRDDDIDYKELFPNIASSYKEKEIHMFDSLNSDVVPYDSVIYNLTDELKEFLKKTKKLNDIFYSPVNGYYAMFNPLFCNGNEGFAIINTDTNQMGIQLKDEEYEEFKALKIKHEVEFIDNEN